MENQKTNFFSLVEPLLNEGYTLTLSMKKVGNVVVVSTLPQQPEGLKDEAFKALPPLILKHSVEDLNESYFETIQAPMSKTFDAMSSVEQYEKNLAEASKKTADKKKEKDVKKAEVASIGKFASHVKDAENHEKDKNWMESLKSWKNALVNAKSDDEKKKATEGRDRVSIEVEKGKQASAFETAKVSGQKALDEFKTLDGTNEILTKKVQADLKSVIRQIATIEEKIGGGNDQTQDLKKRLQVALDEIVLRPKLVQFKSFVTANNFASAFPVMKEINSISPQNEEFLALVDKLKGMMGEGMIDNLLKQ